MHDRNGKPLAVGDEVVIHGKVVETFPNATTCNIRLELTDRQPGGTMPSFYTLTSNQVEKVEKVE